MALPPSANGDSEKSVQRKAAQQDVFLREVDDALRHDQMEGFFKRYGVPVLAALVIGLLAFGGYLYWQHRSRAQAEEHAEKFVQALDDLDANNLKAADEKLAALAGQGGPGADAAARLMRAGIALEQQRTAEAVKLYGEVAQDSAVPQPLRDLATVREVTAGFDTIPPQAVIDRLKPLAVKGNPWFGLAGELVGIAYLKQGKQNLAGPLFAQIARDETLPDSLRSRARQLAGILGQDALDDVVEEKSASGENAAAAPGPAAE
ncbi:tetratricopeptide repeat protein [Novosphingobium album (ex Liu et al. 2023)]|uniref:Tetratricopeptide repeat protein n=1 Tax=Novosphingobium album (ex Liu et al. 2023) TaxID=3031130 RepID=A0ABT5WSD5_9SPHN|nr:tetratricopeptide repeat protein [Novosphingobium album (ex Liu et al. 2023)]MDE8652958.1 tetratricopeptide repeat protein [Novosphingobium album (ex Liu et al. 2023)]